MSKTKKNIVDDIIGLLTKFKVTDEIRLDPDWMGAKIDDVRADLIRQEYFKTRQIDQTWLSDVSLINFTKTNYVDNPSGNFDCNIAKTTVPQVLTLSSSQGNFDLGIYSLISACGNYSYQPWPLSRWKHTPNCHSNSAFKWYWRHNSVLYVSDQPTQLRLVAILLTPEDGKLINSASVPSGSIATGVSYTVRYGQVFYDSAVYQPGSTFTGTAVTTYATQTGVVYLTDQIEAYSDVDPYPASGDMIRNIEIEILTKEFGIEKQQIPDLMNNSIDDAQRVIR